MKLFKHPLRAIAAASMLALPVAAWSTDEMEMRELSAQWWQWALSIPAPVNPLNDAGDPAPNCMVGQRDPVWFLAGSFGTPFSRGCSVPEGVPIFFPVVNSVQVNTPGVCGQVGELTVQQMRKNNAEFINSITSMSATLDDKKLAPVRVRSTSFATTLPVDNVFLPFCGGDSPPGVFSPSVADGYWVKLNGLRAGEHVLKFDASNSSGFTLTGSYRLTVVPVAKR